MPNPNHEPAGSSKGGEFAKSSGTNQNMNDAIRRKAKKVDIRTFYSNLDPTVPVHYYVNNLDALSSGKIKSSNIMVCFKGVNQGVVLASDGLDDVASHSEMLFNYDVEDDVDSWVRAWYSNGEIKTSITSAGIVFDESTASVKLIDKALDNIDYAVEAVENLGFNAPWSTKHDVKAE